MSLNSAIPVRFSKEMSDRLRSVSDNTGVPVAQLIRIATEAYLLQIERSRSVTIALRDAPCGNKHGPDPSAGKQLK